MYNSRRAQGAKKPRLTGGVTGIAVGSGGERVGREATPTPAPPSPEPPEQPADVRRPSQWINSQSLGLNSQYAREQAKAQLESITGRMFQVSLWDDPE